MTKQTVKCVNCGTENTYDSSQEKLFCCECGKDLSKYIFVENKTSSSNFVICESCGAKIDKGERFCGECGKKLTNYVPVDNKNINIAIFKFLIIAILILTSVWAIYYGVNYITSEDNSGSIYVFLYKAVIGVGIAVTGAMTIINCIIAAIFKSK